MLHDPLALAVALDSHPGEDGGARAARDAAGRRVLRADADDCRVAPHPRRGVGPGQERCPEFLVQIERTLSGAAGESAPSLVPPIWSRR